MHENNLQLSSRTGQAARPRASRSIRHQLRSASTEHARGLLHGPRTSVDRALYKKRSQRFNHRSPDCGHDLTLKYHADQQHDAKATAAARTAARGAPLSDWPHCGVPCGKLVVKSPGGGAIVPRPAARRRRRGGAIGIGDSVTRLCLIADCPGFRVTNRTYIDSITNCSRQGQRPQSTESTHGPTHWTLQPHVPDNTSRDDTIPRSSCTARHAWRSLCCPHRTARVRTHTPTDTCTLLESMYAHHS